MIRFVRDNMLIIIVTALYAAQGFQCLLQSKRMGSLVWFGYAVANVGIMCGTY